MAKYSLLFFARKELIWNANQQGGECFLKLKIYKSPWYGHPFSLFLCYMVSDQMRKNQQTTWGSQGNRQ